MTPRLLPFSLILLEKAPSLDKTVNNTSTGTRRGNYKDPSFGVIQVQDIFRHLVLNISKARHNIGLGYNGSYSCVLSAY